MHPDVLQSLQTQPKIFLPTRDEFLASYRKQAFALPNSIVYYIANNPSTPELYQKMVQCCKYFFIKNPILVIQKMGPLHLPKVRYLNGSTKIWIFQQLIVPPCPYNYYQWLFSLILPKLYKPEILNLRLGNVSLKYDEFLLLSTSAKAVGLDNVSVKYSNNNENEVELETIVEASSKAIIIEYAFSSNATNFSSNTITNLTKIPHLLNMRRISLYEIPDTFDVTLLIEFLKKTDLFITLTFCSSISENYRNQLRNIVYDILNSDSYVYGPPILVIPGIASYVQEALYRKARKPKK